MDQLSMMKSPNVYARLSELGIMLNAANCKYNRQNPVRMINMNGRICRLQIRIINQEIPDPIRCEVALEKKLFEIIGGI